MTRFYFAPMEGITGYVYRNAFHTYFESPDKYFTPFISPVETHRLRSREKSDILPEHNKGLPIVPQILTNNPEYFLKTAQVLEDAGYKEVNLNLGCPSKTVVTKGKGAGLLAHPKELEAILDQIFSRATIKISIKTRIGMENPEEFYELLTIFNQFPLEELIIHPRVQKDFYKNKPHYDIFTYAVSNSRNPICYNGDIFSVEDYIQWKEWFPQTDRVMLGRGLLINPFLLSSLQEGNAGAVDIDRLRGFHDCVYMGYQKIMSGDKNVLFKMKEFWFYLIQSFAQSEKYAKQIKKTERLDNYERAVDMVFRDLDWKWKV